MHVREWQKIHLIWKRQREHMAGLGLQHTVAGWGQPAFENQMLRLCCFVDVVFGVPSPCSPASLSAVSPPPIKLVGGYFLHKQQQGFSPPVSDEGELMFPFQKHFPPLFPQRAERCAHHVLFMVPVTPQMSQGKTASIPAWLFPPDFSNAAGNSRAGSRDSSYGEPGESAASLPSW